MTLRNSGKLSISLYESRITKFIRHLSSISQKKRNGSDYKNDEKGHSKRTSTGGIWATVSGIAAVSVLLHATQQKNQKTNFLIWPTVEAKTVKQLAGRRSQFNFIADVVDVCASSVVYIEIKDTRHYDFHSKSPLTASNGSGFIIDSNGLILTNAHVVINKPHSIVQVKLCDGRTFRGVVENVDQSSDLATIRIQCSDLPVMKLGESSSLRSGEWVVALGSPLALSNTVTAGVVSSTQRPSQELGLRGRDINYIQTDAAITFGNSGGPLVNLDGEAIGINSMKVTSGISFAIPIDYVKQFLNRAAERTTKPDGRKYPLQRYLGMTMVTLTDELLKTLKKGERKIPDEVAHGVLVWKVILESPAHLGGLIPGDIVVQVNQHKVRSSADIYDVLSENTEILNVVIFRGMKKINLSLKPEDS